MVEMSEHVKETKKKYRYYNINLWVIPEVEAHIEDISYFFIREYIKELLTHPHVILSVPKETAEEFFNTNGYTLRRIHAKKDLYEMWKTLPRGFKKRLSYIVNKKLLEVLNDELRTAGAPAS
jgi:hypothetical protein